MSYNSGMKKKLYRNTEEKLVAGVLAGLADYYNQDVVFFRLAFVVLLIVTGFMPGVLVYIVAMVIVPEQPTIEPLDTSEYTIYQ
jgi:phage shock protein C